MTNSEQITTLVLNWIENNLKTVRVEHLEDDIRDVNVAIGLLLKFNLDALKMVCGDDMIGANTFDELIKTNIEKVKTFDLGDTKH